MENKVKSSLFLLIFFIATTPILSFADDSEITIVPAAGSGAPGCEKTADKCYIPYAASIGVGSTVIFSNIDTAAHTFTSGNPDDGANGIFDTGMVMAGGSFSLTFDKEGTYNYFCMLHPWMTGVILVDDNYSQKPKYSDIHLFTDKESYTEGDTIRIFGTVSNNLGMDMSLVIEKPGAKIIAIEQLDVKPNNTFETHIKIGKTFDVDGVYSIKVQYGSENADLVAFEFHQLTRDTVPPLLLVPSDMLIETLDQKGVIVEYSVKAIDDVDGVLESFCNPSSGSMFPVGDTMVTCQTFDNSGNDAYKSFRVTVQLDVSSPIIPDWIKEVSGFWCNDEINDDSFVEAIQYLIENNVIHVPLDYNSSTKSSQIIPDWIKNNACWWSENLISDDDFASGLEYLVRQGIISV